MIRPRKPTPNAKATFRDTLRHLCQDVANEMSVSVSIILCIVPFIIAVILWRKIRGRRKRKGENHDLPDLPQAVPTLPPHLLQRHSLKDRIVDALIRDADKSTEMGVHFVLGRDGTGKSTLVAAAVRSPEVRKCFSGGIVWIDASKKWGECGNGAAIVSLLRQYREVQRQLNIQSLDPSDPFVAQNGDIDGTQGLNKMEEAKDLLTSFLSKRKPTLIVLKNLQAREDAKWFSVSGRVSHQCLIIMDDESIWRVLPSANFTYCGSLESGEALSLLSNEADHPAVHLQKSLDSFNQIAAMSQHLPLSVVAMGRSMAFQASRGDVVPAVSLLGAMKTSCAGQTRGVDELMKALDGIIMCTFREEAVAARLCFAALVNVFGGKNHPKQWLPISVVDTLFQECCASIWISGPCSYDDSSEVGDLFLKQAQKSQGIRIRQLFSVIGLLKVLHKEHIKTTALCCQISHDVFRQYGYYLSITRKEISDGCQIATHALLAKLTENERMSCNKSAVPVGTDIFVLEALPYHMIVSGRLEDAADLLQHQQFCSHRLGTLGFVEAVRLHVADNEELCLRSKDGSKSVTSISPPVLTMKKSYAAMSACLSEMFMSTKDVSRRRVGKILYEMGVSLLHHGSRANALRYFEDAIKIQREAISESQTAIGRTINNVGMLYKGRKEKSSMKYSDASKTISEGFSIGTLKRTPELFVGATSRERPAYEDESLWFYKEQLWTRMQELVDGPTVDLARSLLTTCSVHYSSDDCDEAVGLLDIAIQTYILLGLPKDHPNVRFLLKCKEKTQKLTTSNSYQQS